jgi:hypothetical protein
LGAINDYAHNELGFPLIGILMIAVERGGLSKSTTLSVTEEVKFLFQDLNPGK